MRLCNYCQGTIDNPAVFKATLSPFVLGEYVFCDEDCAAKRIAKLEAENARLRAELDAAEIEIQGISAALYQSD